MQSLNQGVGRRHRLGLPLRNSFWHPEAGRNIWHNGLEGADTSDQNFNCFVIIW